jgi:hypothetical protein
MYTYIWWCFTQNNYSTEKGFIKSILSYVKHIKSANTAYTYTYLHINWLQYPPNLSVCMCLKWIQVKPHRSWKNNGVLRNNSYFRPIYMYKYIYIYICLCVCIYIYIYREREKVTGSWGIIPILDLYIYIYV